jgi:uncharacterized membrane protein (UPF0182 family)
MPPWVRRVVPVVVVLVVLLILWFVFANLYTNYLWYKSVGFTKVFNTILVTKLELFAVFGFLMAFVIGLNVVIARRLRPTYPPVSREQENLDRYRVGIERFRWVFFTVLMVIVWIAAGLSAANRWRTWVTWRHAVPFHVKDAQFHKDISYYAFTYPFQRWVLGFAFTAIALSLVAVAVTYYLYGALRVQTPGEKVTPAARAHLSTLLGIFVLLKAFAYFLDRYGLAFSERGIVTGPSYTDVHAVLPAKTILVFIAIICAGLFFANIVYRRWTLPIVALGAMVLSAIVIGGIYPAIVQQFRVKPSEQDKEALYIGRNIAATRDAYGLTDNAVTVTPYDAVTTATTGQLRSAAGKLPGIRLLDPSVVEPTFTQLQQFRGYYQFPPVLDIDRYKLNGVQTDAVVADRDIDLRALQGSQKNWINQHLVYTHGFGFVGATATQVDPDGKPNFFEENVPPRGSLTITQPRIYFGESSPSYSIVGGPPGKPGVELDRPTDVARSTGQINTTYTGSGGAAVGSLWRRLLFATKFHEKNILLSSRVNSHSRILYVRDPRARVHKVAPYLRLDGDPYSAVINGHIVWIVDGYTTSDGYPYSEQTPLSQVTKDTFTQSSSNRQQPSQNINYIRNSVKATVDAYDGTVTLYAWDPTDPILQTWEKVFPHTVKPKSDIPAALLPHFRYPEDLFKVQRTLLAKYHVTDARAFYTGQDFWEVPADPTQLVTVPQPPYYFTLAMPGQSSATFSLTSTLVPRNRNNMAAFISVDSDPGPDYGKIRILQLPRDTQINGPEQVQNNFESDPEVSKTLSLLRQGGSSVVLGNLLTMPVGHGLLFVEPVYVRAAGGTSYPLMRKVLVSFGNSIAFEDTLQQALDTAFKGASGVTVPSGGPQPPSTPASADVKAAIADARAAYAAGQKALKAGDFAAYGRAQAQLAAALQRLRQLTNIAPHPAPSTSVSSKPSSTPTTSP